MLCRQALYITRWPSTRASCRGPGRATAAVPGRGLALSSGQLVLARRFPAGPCRIAGMGRIGQAIGGVAGAMGGAAGCAIKTTGPLGALLLLSAQIKPLPVKCRGLLGGRLPEQRRSNCTPDTPAAACTGCAAVGVAGGVFLLRAKNQIKTLNAALQAAELQVCHTLGAWRQALTQPGPIFFALKKPSFKRELCGACRRQSRAVCTASWRRWAQPALLQPALVVSCKLHMSKTHTFRFLRRSWRMPGTNGTGRALRSCRRCLSTCAVPARSENSFSCA